jgi:hypothetical protein
MENTNVLLLVIFNKELNWIQQTQYFISVDSVEIDLSVVPERLGISDFFTCPVEQP